MKPVDLLLLPDYVVPIEPAGTVWEGHAIVVSAGRIEAVPPTAEAQARYRPAETLRLAGHAVMPGLVNLHTHSAMSLMRGLADDLPLMDWLQQHIWPAEAAHVGRQFCYDGVRLAMAEMIRGGQTCFNDMYFFPDATADAASACGMRAVVGLIVLDFATAWAQPGDYIAKGLDLHARLAGEPLVSTVFAPHAPYTVADERLAELREHARRLDVGIHMHVHETAFEVSEAVKSTGMRPWQRLRGLELLDERFVAVHMTQLTDEEIAEAGALGVHIAHCPESNLKLASGFCPVQKLLDAGANVGLGTDGAASNNDLDLFGELRTAALIGKAVAGDPRAVSAEAALRMATLGGARALGLDREIGSIAPGKAADLISIDLRDASTTPNYHLMSTLAYAVNSRQVANVFVAGRALLRDGRLMTLSTDELFAKAAEWRARIGS